jgi:hypothetical protein
MTNTQAFPHSLAGASLGEGFGADGPSFQLCPNTLSTVLQFDSLNSAPKTPTQKQWCDMLAWSRPSHLAILTATGPDAMAPRRHPLTLDDGRRQEDEQRLGAMQALLQAMLSRLRLNGLGSRCSTATSSGYSASTSIAFRCTTKYKAAPRAGWRHLADVQHGVRGTWVHGFESFPSIPHAPQPWR